MNKRAFAGGALVVGVILLALLFFIIFKMTAEGTSTVKKDTDSLVDKFLGSFDSDMITENALLDVPVPDKLLNYTYNLSRDLFANPKFSKSGTGKLYLIEPFKDYPKNSKLKKEYEDFRIMFSYSTFYKNPGIMVIIFNENTEQYLLVDSPRDSDYLQGKNLCVLSNSPTSSAIASALIHSSTKKYPAISPFLSPATIIKKGETKAVSLYFEEEITGYNDGVRDFYATKLFSSGISKPIFKFGESASLPNKFPVYVYDNSLCFFELGYAKNPLTLTTISSTEVKGTGPLHWTSYHTLTNFINTKG